MAAVFIFLKTADESVAVAVLGKSMELPHTNPMSLRVHYMKTYGIFHAMPQQPRERTKKRSEFQALEIILMEYWLKPGCVHERDYFPASISFGMSSRTRLAAANPMPGTSASRINVSAKLPVFINEMDKIGPRLVPANRTKV